MRKIALVAAVVALACTQACAATTPGASAPAPSTSPPVGPSASPAVSPAASPASPAASPATPSASASAASALSGKRQVFLFPLHKGAEVPESVVAVTAKNRADVTADFGDRALFVPVPTAPRSKTYLMKTGKLRSGGEALCLQVQGNGSNPLTLVTKACDAANKDQTFAFQDNGRDNQGRTTYLIHVDGVYLHYSPDGRYGLIVEESGEGDDLTSFVVVDRGTASIPALD
jgi:hypothetical protein